MAIVVLVHGIAQEQYSADTLESKWLPALAGGVRAAGFPEIADRLWRDRSGPGGIEARMAFYGYQFLPPPNQQGAGDGKWSEAQALLAEPLALEWLEAAAQRASQPQEQATATRELAHVHNQIGQQVAGAGAVARSAINSLARLRWFAPLGMAFAERFVRKALTQITRYFTDETIRRAALQSVLDLMGPETKVVIGHSLGSVVAYEAVHQYNQPLSLLITLGSPLGLRTIIYDKLRPQPPTFPAQVKRWVNIAGKDDFIAAAPNLTELFAANLPPEATLFENLTADNGAEPHQAIFYLNKAQVGRPLGEVLTS